MKKTSLMSLMLLSTLFANCGLETPSDFQDDEELADSAHSAFLYQLSFEGEVYADLDVEGNEKFGADIEITADPQKVVRAQLLNLVGAMKHYDAAPKLVH